MYDFALVKCFAWVYPMCPEPWVPLGTPVESYETVLKFHRLFRFINIERSRTFDVSPRLSRYNPIKGHK